VAEREAQASKPDQHHLVLVVTVEGGPTDVHPRISTDIAGVSWRSRALPTPSPTSVSWKLGETCWAKCTIPGIPA